VEGEPVHGPTAGELHADGGDLARRGAVGLDPDARVVVEAADVGQAELDDRVDHQLLHGADVGNRVSHPPAPLPGHGEDRVPDQLTGAVVGDVAAAIGPHQLGT